MMKTFPWHPCLLFKCSINYRNGWQEFNDFWWIASMSISHSETNEATKRRREDDGNDEGNEEEKLLTSSSIIS